MSHKEGGFMSIGGYNSDQHIDNEAHIVPISRESKQYNIRIHKLKVVLSFYQQNIFIFLRLMERI